MPFFGWGSDISMCVARSDDVSSGVWATLNGGGLGSREECGESTGDRGKDDGPDLNDRFDLEAGESGPGTGEGDRDEDAA